MKTFRNFTIFAILLSCIVVSCKKETETETDTLSVGECEFMINVTDLKSSFPLKSDSVASFDNVRKIVLTIKKTDGSPTKYNGSEITVYQLNGALYSQKITLAAGAYNLSEFLLIDDFNNIIYAAPAVGSVEAQNSTMPLPLLFTISKNRVNKLKIEVLSTKGKKPEDFGLIRFSVNEVKTYNLGIGCIDVLTESFINPTLTITATNYKYSVNLESVANNIVTIRQGLGTYTLTFEKSGYGVVIKTYSEHELVNLLADMPIIFDFNPTDYLLVDIEGNTYKTLTINGKTWMMENLRTTTYNDGTPINYVSNFNTGLYEEPAYSNYMMDTASTRTYGQLYNWFAVNTGKLAPIGWHVPSVEEWKELLNYFGGSALAGGALKETGFTHWSSPNTGATNSSGFTGLPGGKIEDGNLSEIGTAAYFWTSTPWNSGDPAAYLYAYYTFLKYNNTNTTPSNLYVFKQAYFSIRCVKD